MSTLTSAINVNVDSKIKEEATNILKNLGLNMSTFINMALTQVVKRNGVPFEVVNPEPSKELLEVLKEIEVIKKEIKEGKREGYNNCKECHIRPYWLLVYTYYDDKLILLLVETGSHSELFK